MRISVCAETIVLLPSNARSLHRNSPLPSSNVDAAAAQCNSCESLWNSSRSRVLLCAVAVAAVIVIVFNFAGLGFYVVFAFAFQLESRQRQQRHASHAPMTNNHWVTVVSASYLPL